MTEINISVAQLSLLFYGDIKTKKNKTDDFVYYFLFHCTLSAQDLTAALWHINVGIELNRKVFEEFFC